MQKVGDVIGFIVKDNGIGFNKENRDSFDTLYTEHKISSGGKGFGRFTCLKYFKTVTVESVFHEDGKSMRRSFNMGFGTDIITKEKITETSNAKTGSIININGIRSIKFQDKSIDVISRILFEKLLPYIIDEKSYCPKITINDDSSVEEITLTEYLTRPDKQVKELKIDKNEFHIKSPSIEYSFYIRAFKFYSPRTSKSKISLVAHNREVTETPIYNYIPEFIDEFYETEEKDSILNGRNYIVKAYVFGEYLDSNVSLERGSFNFQKEQDLIYGISQVDIEKQAANITQEALGSEISARKERKKATVEAYIDHEAPWHRELGQETDFSELPMNPSPDQIEMFLQEEKFKREVTTRQKVKEILNSEKNDSFEDRVSDVVQKISQTSKNDLVHYVSMRKCVLDIFGKSLDSNIDRKYSSEGEVHDIIMPRRKDIDQINYEDHNLWILDERLNFSGYVSSDKPLDGKRGDRTDITIFGKRIAFRGDNDASNPITIFEFKKPLRDNFCDPSSDEDPVFQIVRYVNAIRDGKYLMPNGREILVSENTPFYG